MSPRRRRRHLGLRCEQAHRNEQQKGRPQDRNRHTPAEGVASCSGRGDRDGDVAGDVHSRPVDRRPCAHGEPLLLGLEGVDRVGVDGDVLRSRGEGDQHRKRTDQRHLRMTRSRREPEAETGKRKLPHQDPAALAAQSYPVAIHQRRPKKLADSCRRAPSVTPAQRRATQTRRSTGRTEVEVRRGLARMSEASPVFSSVVSHVVGTSSHILGGF